MREIQPNIVKRLKRLHRRANVPLPATDIHEALTYKLGPCIDWLKALCNERNPTIANDAILCLQDLVRHIASEIKDDQVEATLAHGGSQGFIFCAENYLWLASSCFHTPRWSVITLNYDTVLDRAFEEIGLRDPRTSQYDSWRELVEAHFANKRMSPVKIGMYLKIHGSLDIYECLNPQCKLFRSPFNTRGNERVNVLKSGFFIESLASPDAAPHCTSCNRETVELILPPGHNNSQEETAFHDLVYGEAEQALGRADTWIVLGYSCPDYDVDVMNLMKGALKQKPPTPQPDRSIWVVAPDADSVAHRLTQHLQHYVGFVKSSFTEFVDQILQIKGIERPGLA